MGSISELTLASTSASIQSNAKYNRRYNPMQNTIVDTIQYNKRTSYSIHHTSSYNQTSYNHKIRCKIQSKSTKLHHTATMTFPPTITPNYYILHPQTRFKIHFFYVYVASHWTPLRAKATYNIVSKSFILFESFESSSTYTIKFPPSKLSLFENVSN